MKCKQCHSAGEIHIGGGYCEICEDCCGTGKVTLKIWLKQLYEEIVQLIKIKDKDYNIKASDLFVINPGDFSFGKKYKKMFDMINKEMDRYLQYCKENNLEPDFKISALHTDAKVYWEIQDAMRKYNEEN